jgi:hypothetical protein
VQREHLTATPEACACRSRVPRATRRAGGGRDRHPARQAG